MRIPLVNPNQLLSRLLPHVRGLTGPGALLLFSVIWVTGLYQLLADPTRLGQAAAAILYPANWIWASLPPGQASDIAFNIVLIATVSTLLFNANPLMRFDGYFILTDLIAIPNLYAKGQRYIGYLGRRYLLGMPDDWSPGAGPAKDLFIRLYAVLAPVWRLLLTEDLPAYQAQQRELASLERKLQELELRRQELGLRAPREGRVLAWRLPDLAGTHVKTGFELMSVVDEGRKAIRMSVAAADFPLLTLNLGDQIAVSLPGRSGRMFHGRLRQTTPRATTRLEIPMLAVTNGGPLPVRPKTSVETDSVTQDGEHFEYLEPRVILETSLDDDDSLALYAGEVGVARLPTAPRPLGDHALTALQDWLEHMLERRDDRL